MPTQKQNYTSQEVELAKRLFERAKAAGILKRPRAIAALVSNNGFRQVVTASSVTFRDYLSDARALLARRRASGTLSRRSDSLAR